MSGMLQLNGDQLYRLEKLRREECLRQAERLHLAESVEPEDLRPVLNPVLAWPGDGLVTLGERLQAKAGGESALRLRVSSEKPA